ncbi:MAG: T9SS type A sorting domain-containing protein [Saprospiraceae bacterium]|jgi:hypothetical protein
MKTIYPFCLTAFFLTFTSIHQAQNFDWAVQIEGVSPAAANSNSYDVETDAQGNVFIAGTFVGQVKFGSQTLESTGIVPGALPDGFIAKFSASGAFEWVEQIPASLDAKVRDIELDAAGNIFFAADIFGVASFGGTSAGVEGDRGIVVGKLNPDRELQWMQSFISESNNEPVFIHSLELGANGDLYISGDFEGDMNLGGIQLDAGAESRFFLARLNQDEGDVFWASVHGISLPLDPGSDVATDFSSNVYFTGSTIGNSDFGGIAVDATDERTFVLVKFDSTGAAQWLRRSHGESLNLEDRGEGVAVHPSSGEVYVAGTFISDTFDIAGLKLFRSGFCCQNFFIAKFSPAGDILWAKQSHGPAPQAEGRDIEVDDAGDAYATGIYGEPATGGAIPLEVTLGEGGQAVLLENTGYLDIFLAKYSNSGSLLWAKRASGTEADYVTSLALAGMGNAAITGTFNETFTVGSQTFMATPTPATDNMFVAFCDGDLSGVGNRLSRTARLVLSPNPASDMVKVEIQSEITLKGWVELLNANGVVLRRSDIGSVPVEFSTNGLPEGIYFIRLATDKGSLAEKLVLGK